MADGEAVPESGWRVRLGGGSDADALKAWLEREELLGGLVREGRLRFEVRPSAGGEHEHMGLQMDLVVQIVDSVADLATIGGVLLSSVHAWRSNRDRVTGEATADPPVDPLDPDQE
ncbi:hypothetical protein ACVNF4_04510 [Streptomyces sp. S6]